MLSTTNLPSYRALAIETSGQNGSVALVEGTTILAQGTFPHGLKHASGLLPLIDGLMTKQGWSPNSLQCLYVSHGPGSFTGLRIGITLAKTVAFTIGAKIAAVPSLQVLAMNAPEEAKNVLIVLDAKRDQIFTGRYERQDDKWIEREQAHLDSLATALSRSPRPVHLLGEGIPYHEHFMPPDRAGVFVTVESTWTAKAENVARIGFELARQDQFVDVDTFAPLYIRKPEAEEKWEAGGK